MTARLLEVQAHLPSKRHDCAHGHRKCHEEFTGGFPDDEDEIGDVDSGQDTEGDNGDNGDYGDDGDDDNDNAANETEGSNGGNSEDKTGDRNVLDSTLDVHASTRCPHPACRNAHFKTRAGLERHYESRTSIT